jgi:hypothetical protein
VSSPVTSALSVVALVPVEGPELGSALPLHPDKTAAHESAHATRSFEFMIGEPPGGPHAKRVPPMPVDKWAKFSWKIAVYS